MVEMAGPVAQEDRARVLPQAAAALVEKREKALMEPAAVMVMLALVSVVEAAEVWERTVEEDQMKVLPLVIVKFTNWRTRWIQDN
jgi:hypothetical protein